MAYDKLTTAANIQAYFLGVDFSISGASVTTAEVENWVQQATSIIYGALNQVYVIPVTDADDLKQLESLADMYVLTNVKLALNPNQLKSVNDNTLKVIQPDHSLFYKMLEKYKTSALVLNNTSNNASTLQAKSYNETNNIEPVAKKYEEQW